jgi:hypothetical protein
LAETTAVGRKSAETSTRSELKRVFFHKLAQEKIFKIRAHYTSENTEAAVADG